MQHLKTSNIMEIKNFIHSILLDLSENKPLNSISTKLQIIATALNDTSFCKWIECEFVKGYNGENSIPDYRKIKMLNVKASYITYAPGGMVQYKNQLIPIENLGQDIYEKYASIRVNESVPSLIKILSNQEHQEDISFSITPTEMKGIQSILGNCQIQEAHKEIAVQDLYTIVEHVKSVLIQKLLKLNSDSIDEIIANNKMSNYKAPRITINNYNPAVVNNSNENINNNISTIIAGNKNNITIGADTQKELNKIVEQIDKLSQEVADDREGIAEAILEVRSLINAEKPIARKIRMGFNAIRGVLASVMNNTIEALIEEGLKLLK